MHSNTLLIFLRRIVRLLPSAALLASAAALSLTGRVMLVVIMGSSMEPTFAPGSLTVFVRDDAYSIGTVILFRVHGRLVAHRIMSEVEGGFKTKGDNCASIDPWIVPRDAALGRLLLSIPHLGSILMALRSPLAFAAVATAAFALLTRPIFLQRGKGSQEGASSRP